MSFTAKDEENNRVIHGMFRIYKFHKLNRRYVYYVIYIYSKVVLITGKKIVYIENIFTQILIKNIQDGLKYMTLIMMHLAG